MNKAHVDVYYPLESVIVHIVSKGGVTTAKHKDSRFLVRNQLIQ